MSRLDKLCHLMAENGMEAAFISKPENIRYLSGYKGEGALFIHNNAATILTDFRYIEQAARESPGVEVLRTTADVKAPDHVRSLVNDNALRTVGFEPEVMTVSEYDQLKAALGGMELKPLGGLPEMLREVKDEHEISCINRAAAIACEAFDVLLGIIKPGMTEREIQLELDYTMFRLGSEKNAFDTIACAGPNGSLPHAVPSDRPIKSGELLTLDFGAQIDGYKSDMTRTIAIGKIPGELRAIYEAVLEAQTAAFAAIRPGAMCSEIDKIARDILEAKYPGAFGHSLGHSVGLEIHEAPNFSSKCGRQLIPGNVMTVEPGVYIAGLGGCRIENMAIITQDGYTDPVTSPRTLITV